MFFTHFENSFDSAKYSDGFMWVHSKFNDVLKLDINFDDMNFVKTLNGTYVCQFVILIVKIKFKMQQAN